MSDYNPALDEVQEVTEDRGVPCEDIGGVAGSGKTYAIVQAVAGDAHYGILCATTGIAAVNLGATTLHSLLRFFDTASARDWYLSGGLVRVLHGLAREYRRLIIDEKSMLDGALLDILYRGVREANRYADVTTPMGITLVGDWCQLPPVRARWAFEASCWPEFACNSRVLTTQWRQSDPAFVDALNAVRRGDGALGAELLTAAGTQWHTQLDPDFAGTTILPVNRQVERYNALALDKVPGRSMKIASRRWGRQRPEWGESRSTHEWGIPQALEVKLGAYVMLLANSRNSAIIMEYGNQSTSHLPILQAGVQPPSTLGVGDLERGEENKGSTGNKPQEVLQSELPIQMGQRDQPPLESCNGETETRGSDSMERRSDNEAHGEAQSIRSLHGGLCIGVSTGAPKRTEMRICTRTSNSDGEENRSDTIQEGASPSSECGTARQSPRELGIDSPQAASSGQNRVSLLQPRVLDTLEFSYVNGDCGYIVSYNSEEQYLLVRLVRNGNLVKVERIVRAVDTHEKPEGWDGRVIPAAEDDGAYVPEPHYRGKSRRYVAGQVEFMPVRLAYASSVHKSQSLTLDRVQCDIRHNFFGSPAMLYTALSRCRTREGLRIIGQREVFVKRCAVDEKVRPYL